MFKHLRRGLLLVLLLAAGLPALVVSTSQNADAICQGRFTTDPVWRAYGKEDAAYPQTCNADGFYWGRIKDKKTDGYCVDVRMRVPADAHIPETGWDSIAIACKATWSEYYYDQSDTWLEENGEQDRDVVVCKAYTYICKYWKAEFMWGY